MRAFLEAGGFKAFTTTFEDLYGLAQLPGLAVQRLMNGWLWVWCGRRLEDLSPGAGDEGDGLRLKGWHILYGRLHLSSLQQWQRDEGAGAHMLEVCSSIADGKPSLEMHPLAIGGKADPARLVFNVPTGPAINASLIDLGNRFRMIVNEVEVVPPDAPLPKLPVARVVWIPRPNLKVAAAAWIYAGGAHHTGFSQAVTARHIEDYADMAGIEYVLIDDHTDLSAFKKELRWNEVYYHLAQGL